VSACPRKASASRANYELHAVGGASQDKGGTRARAKEFALLRCERGLAEASTWVWGSVSGQEGAYGGGMERTDVGLCMEFLR